MTVRCPTCGAEVEFRYDDSFVRVCDHCRAAVVRTDRGPETLGQFADVMPIASGLRLFAEGRYGTTGFLLIGMAQLRHAAGGVWQEWYAKLDGGQWAWISEAQGRLYLTFERPDLAVPSIAQLAGFPAIDLAGARFSVGERGTATYVAALGEIPYRLVPGSSFQFADLADGRGGFATVDYGDGSEPPAVYLGYQVTLQGLGLSGGEAPQLATPTTGARLACPNCGGSLELRVPDQTLRVACPFCNNLVSVEGGTLSIIARQAKKPAIAIALGSKATFSEGELTVIGYVARSSYVDGQWWPFEEYLLHAPGVGFRWLVCSDGHWSYVQPVATGAVARDPAVVAYDGVTFQRFQSAELRVDSVLGEFYWRVQAGEKVFSQDFIAPPAMLSFEASAQEQNWSLSTYLTPADVERAVGKPLGLPRPTGVGPNQPYPGGRGKVSALVVVAFCAVGIGKCASAPAAEKLRSHVSVPSASAIPRSPVDPALATTPAEPAEPSEPPGAVVFSEKFELAGGRNVRFDISADLQDSWMFVALDLVNDTTGGVVSINKSLEYYSGFDSDGSWSEGSRTAREVISPVEPGTYLLRIEAQHGGALHTGLDVTVRQGVFRWFWFSIGLYALALPLGLVALHAYSFRKRRWENSNRDGSHSFAGDEVVQDDEDDDDD